MSQLSPIDMTLLSPIDFAIQSACPMVMATAGSPLPMLTEPGKRLIAGRAGIYLEARSPCLHLCLLAEPTEKALPFGPMEQFVRPINGPVPAHLPHQFIAQSIEARPNETAAGVQWCDHKNAYEFVKPEITHASAGHVVYRDCFDDDRLVLDMHSHGLGDAFFSATDDESDISRRGPYLAIVVGYSEKYADTPLVCRAVCAPYLIDLDLYGPIMKGVFQ